MEFGLLVLRYHNNEFYIYYPDPDYGIYMIKTKNPKGPWSEPVMVKEGKGLLILLRYGMKMEKYI